MAICDLVVTWVDSMKQVIATLEEEFLALKNKQLDDIVRIAHLKAEQVEALSAIEIQLITQIKAAGFEDLGEFEQTINQVCPDTAAAKIIAPLTREAQQANQRNGVLLSGMIRLNEYGLNLLTGKVDTNKTYSASGQMSNSTSPSTIKLATA